jgi:HEPN domain-containing protein
MIGNWELNGLDEAELHYSLSVANADAACCLSQDMIDGTYESTFSHAKIALSLVHHSVELFLKYALARACQPVPLHHYVRELYEQYRITYPEQAFDFEPPFIVQFIGMSSDQIAEALREEQSDRNQTDQMLRYHTNREGSPWRNPHGFLPEHFLNDTIILLDRMKELKEMIESKIAHQERYGLAFSFWTAAFQYLILAENVSRETASQGNIWVMSRDFGDGPITHREYAEGTRWSDHTIIIPLVFNLLHGIEVLVKGFLLVDPEEVIKKQHNICNLRERFRQKYPDQTILTEFLDKYTSEDHMPELMKRFLEENGLQIETLYQALRYPSPDFTIMCTYSSLKYQGEKGTRFFTELHEDIGSLRVAAVKLGRSLEPQAGEGNKSMESYNLTENGQVEPLADP